MQCALITTRLPLSGYLQLLCPTGMAKIIQLCLTAKRAFYPSVRSPPALHGASACLSYVICTIIA
eukprot:scaffold26652_cov46-Phaeocystis_antarctica.AAC.1